MRGALGVLEGTLDLARGRLSSVRVPFVSPFVIQGGAERYLALLLEGSTGSGSPGSRFSPTGRWSTNCGSAATPSRSSDRRRPRLDRALGPAAAAGAAAAEAGRGARRRDQGRARLDARGGGYADPGRLAQVRLQPRRLARARRRPPPRSIAAVSRAVTETFGRRAREDDGRAARAARPGVDRAAGRAALDGRSGGGPVLGLFGRLDPHKGHREILAVLPRLRERLRHAGRVLRRRRPGSPGLPRSARRRDRGAGLADAVALPGFHRTPSS